LPLAETQASQLPMDKWNATLAQARETSPKREEIDMICIAIALLLLLAAPANAQDAPRVFHDAVGRVTGTARTDSNGVTTFHNAAGRVSGSIRR